MNKITEAIADIKKYNPLFGQFYDHEENLLEYSKNLKNTDLPKEFLDRQKYYKQLIKKKIQFLFGSDFEFNLPKDDEPLIVSTADHHGLLNFPLTNSSNFISNYLTILEKDKSPDIFTIATGNIPVCNATFKRGVDFNGKHINIFSRNERNRLTLAQKSITLSLSKLANSKENKEALKDKGIPFFEKNELSFLRELDEKIFSFSTLTELRTYSDQCSIWNYHLWQKFFTQKLRNRVLRLFILQSEDIDAEFIINIIENNKDSFIYKILFDPSVREMAIEEFNGCYGCWNKKNRTGTSFFFILDKKGQNKPLWLEGNLLVNKKLDVAFEFSENNITEKLRKKEIFPSIVTSFLAMGFWAGIKCLGGMNQVRYLSDYKSRLESLLKKINHPDFKHLKSIDTLGFNTFSIFFGKVNGDHQELYALDIINQGGISQDYLDKLNQFSIRDFLLPSLPLYYKISVPLENRERIEFSKLELSKKLDSLNIIKK